MYRLVTANTIDQRMVERAAAKRKLEKMVIHREKFKGAHRGSDALTVESLLELLQSSEHDAEVNWAAGGQFLKDEDLALLLNRKGLERGPAVNPKLFDVVDEVSASRLFTSVSECSD